ncbi:tRNA lysidine(34) synthetase TilS [Planctomicrobium piriforme]|uniref:tRNA(Ile)-lysidine synthase n=1 Tax=Planctomicrobium piriforme TaxID=1576369 RepID=A0A1I3BN40_9PLAN|nr:tRNA lysidine(34) synthetase TilS [Planctomicrobium piriforme]SFH63580.1 tRNA(Ile)-lysidine synthase [Planctomicrobium piriforme]
MTNDKSPLSDALQSALTALHIQDAPLLVAVSGGADSVALLLGLCDLRESLRLQLTVAHFDHALRADSAEDAQWVSQLAAGLRVPCIIGRREAGDAPHPRPLSSEYRGEGGSEMMPEESARKLRYGFLRQTAKEQGCRYLAVAHTADDQTETVLHHILRGSGLKGLGGIPPQRELDADLTLIRPLLKLRRADLLSALAAWDQTFLTDPTNVELQYTRNRIRHDLLPKLRAEFNPKVDEALERLAIQASDQQAAIEQLARQLLQKAVIDVQPDSIRFNRNEFATMPVAVIREALSLAWQQQSWPRQGLGFQHLDHLASMLVNGTPTKLSLPHGVEAACRGNLLELRKSKRN